MKNLFYLLLIVLISVFASCNNDNTTSETETNNKHLIIGKIENVSSYTGVKARLYQSFNNDVRKLAEVEVNSAGEFVFDTDLSEYGFYMLQVDEGKYKAFLICDFEKITIDFHSANPYDYLIDGSKESVNYTEYIKFSTALDQEITRLDGEYYQAYTEKDMQKVANLTGVLENAYAQKSAKTIQYVKKNAPSFISAMIAQEMLSEYDTYQEEFNYLDSVFADTEKYTYAQDFITQLNNVKKLSIGQLAPDFELTTPTGNSLKLSDLKGKYLLVDFWAAWCGPCRQENPNVLKAYNRFKGKGFDVLGVSLDKDKDKWLQAIQQDGLVWNHVSDLKMWQSEVVPLYSITGIPFALLLDKEGKILAKNLRGDQLEKKLEELLGK